MLLGECKDLVDRVLIFLLARSGSIKSTVSDQNGVSLLYVVLQIHHSGWEPSV